MPRLTDAERLARLQDRQARINAAITKIQTKQKHALRRRSRAEDQRRKIIAGAVVLKHVGADEETDFARAFYRLIDAAVTRDADRALFDLPPRDAETPDPAPLAL